MFNITLLPNIFKKRKKKKNAFKRNGFIFTILTLGIGVQHNCTKPRHTNRTVKQEISTRIKSLY